MNTRTMKLFLALCFAGGTLSLGLGGCGPSASSYCSKACDCVGCSENEQKECVDSIEDAQKAASDEGCSDQYNALFSCGDSEFECRNGQIDDDGCASEFEAYAKCMQ